MSCKITVTMKSPKTIALAVSSLGVLVLANCSSVTGGGPSAKEIAATGPTIMNERITPKTVELNNNLQPFQTPEITADVKDFSANVSNVSLRFLHVPVEVPMKNIGGTTWRAVLSPKE